ncbi:ABC transporter ATP-binding protein [Catalinimonas sp. 4WD22]|uniref:ABC transporter ATP-binding protein n=1 Tax=Catalinimonas locisalis TaxID=3133978 RepID=UPI003100D337
MITINKLYKSFGSNQVLKGVDLDISSGGIFAILGPNGSGKTTLIKSLLGLVIPDKGDIQIDGKLIKKQWLYRQQIAYLPQIARFPENLKVQELIRMVKDIRQQEAVNEAEIIGAFELEDFLDKKLRALSGGTRQKVNILLSLMFDNPIIILDEPTVGLDPVAMIRLKEMILRERAAGKTIILTTHIMSLVENLADEIVFLLEGHIHFRGSLQELVRQSGEVDLEHAIAQMLLKKKESILMMND